MVEQHGSDKERAEEFDREQALNGVIEQYFPEDAEFLADFDVDDRVNAVYGQLLEAGEDPDEILTESGVFEGEGTDEV